LDNATLQALRIHAVRRIVAGERPEQVALALGFARSTIFAWLARYQAGGALGRSQATGATIDQAPSSLQWIH